MTENSFRRVFSRFLYNYWGAFHEVLEAQSVTPRRLARSLLAALHAEHRAFAAMYHGPAKAAVADLGDLWHDVESRQYQFADPALTRNDVVRAQRLFEKVYESLLAQGEAFHAAQQDILKGAPHGRPKEPLRADAGR